MSSNIESPVFSSYLSLTRWTLRLVIFGTIVITGCSALLFRRDLYRAKYFWLFLLAFLVAVTLIRLLEKGIAAFEPWLESLSRRQALFLDQLPMGMVPLAIAASAAASMALELAIIRWQGTVWEIFAFYKNFGLLACFAGLGIGYALSKRDRAPLVLSLPWLALQVCWLLGLRHGMGISKGIGGSLRVTTITEQLNMGLDVATDATHYIAVYLFIITVTLQTILVFLPVGQVCGRLLERTEGLRAYGLNLAGSIAGTLLILLLGYYWTPPLLWLLPGAAVLILLQAFDRRALLIAAGSLIFLAGGLVWPSTPLEELIYTPYQMLERGRGDDGLTQIRAAGHYYQRINNLSARYVEAYPERRPVRDYYELPYRFQPNAGRVAIVGAGTGNDVAAALRRGAREVEAIEIDPVIMEIGRVFHPEAPYSDGRVTRVVDDARTFLRRTKGSYDLIVYGLLDSHSLLSHASSVRLDSFVYTVEGLRDARRRLNENGVVSLSFSVMSPEIGRKIYLMMEQAFDGHPPHCIRAHYDGSILFVNSRDGDLRMDPGLLAGTGFTDVTAEFATPSLHADVSTDDWPFFYMPRRVYPLSYVWILLLMLALTGGVFRLFFQERPRMGHAACFFLGAGFMLVETKAITELGLIYGNVWQVIGIVIISVLVMAFLSNFAVMRLNALSSGRAAKSIGMIAPFFLLLSLLAGLLISARGGLPQSLVGQVLTVVILTLPMFFSGISFSSLIIGTGAVSSAISWNILGAMVGGLLEYNSMYFGFRFLYWIAMALYGLAFLCIVLARRR